jgi:seryl-tRNA synthetase
MLSIQLIRDNKEAVKTNLQLKGVNSSDIDEVYNLDVEYRSYVQQTEELKNKKNVASRKIGELKRNGEDVSAVLAEVDTYGARIGELDTKVKALKDDIQRRIASFPNMLDPSVPIGASEADNVEVMRSGEPTSFNFTPQAHWDLVTELGIVDFERAAKMTGSRFSIYQREGAKLVRALVAFMLDTHINNGYEELMTPAIANGASLYASGQLPKFAEDVFRLSHEKDLYLIPTAEVTLLNYYRDEIIAPDKLPINFTAYTPCFRSEAGSAGRDTRGLIRQHQFDKVELVHFVDPETSFEVLETLRAEAELILQLLKLPYRVITLASGDTGFSAAKTYDLEVWLPSYNAYKEISSCSNCTDFQARRGNIRYRDEEGKTQFVHTLNGSGLAIGRTFAAIIENYQNEDGSVTIPEVLVPYMGGIETIKAKKK